MVEPITIMDHRSKQWLRSRWQLAGVLQKKKKKNPDGTGKLMGSPCCFFSVIYALWCQILVRNSFSYLQKRFIRKTRKERFCLNIYNLVNARDRYQPTRKVISFAFFCCVSTTETCGRKPAVCIFFLEKASPN